MSHDEQNLAGLTPGQHVDPEDLLLYVLEMLTPEEMQRVEQHLGICAECPKELAAIRNEIGIYAVAKVESEGLASAPERSRNRLLAGAEAETRQRSVAGEPGQHAAGAVAAGAAPAMELLSGGRTAPLAGSQAAETRPERTGSKSRAWIGGALIGWALAAAMAVVATHFYQEREALRGDLSTQAGQIAQLSTERARARELVSALTDRSAQRVTLTLTKSPGPPQPTGRASYLAKTGTLVFLASHMEPLPAGKTYELWLIPASGAAPVPAGTFQPDAQGNGSVVTAKLEGAGAAKAFGVTIEASGGSSTPTLPILLAGS